MTAKEHAARSGCCEQHPRPLCRCGHYGGEHQARGDRPPGACLLCACEGARPR